MIFIGIMHARLPIVPNHGVIRRCLARDDHYQPRTIKVSSELRYLATSDVWRYVINDISSVKIFHLKKSSTQLK